MNYEELKWTIALGKVFAYKCVAGRELIAICGTASEVFRLGRKGLEKYLGGAEIFIEQLLNPPLGDWAEAELEWCLRHGIDPLTEDSPKYPFRLATCPDAPLVLFCRGSADLNAEHILAVVGTRRCTWTGREMTRRIVSGMKNVRDGVTIVSGLALGIDGESHRTALDEGLPTIAVIPCGMDEIYPEKHREMASQIAATGAVVTDFTRKTEPVAINFLRRNRIIAGMADATLLAESHSRGGGLITCELADSYGREVFAVSGRPTDNSFAGCNALIEKCSARIANSPESICKGMGWPVRRASAAHPKIPAMEVTDELGLSILEQLSDGQPHTFDALCTAIGAAAPLLTQRLVELELSGAVLSGAGNRYSAVHT